MCMCPFLCQEIAMFTKQQRHQGIKACQQSCLHNMINGSGVSQKLSANFKLNLVLQQLGSYLTLETVSINSEVHVEIGQPLLCCLCKLGHRFREALPEAAQTTSQLGQ